VISQWNGGALTAMAMPAVKALNSRVIDNSRYVLRSTRLPASGLSTVSVTGGFISSSSLRIIFRGTSPG